MEFFRFIKWWWSDTDKSARITFSILSIFVITVTSGFVFGVWGILTIMTILLTGVLARLSFMTYCHIRDKYLKYKNIKEKEADLIVSRLRGRA